MSKRASEGALLIPTRYRPHSDPIAHSHTKVTCFVRHLIRGQSYLGSRYHLQANQGRAPIKRRHLGNFARGVAGHPSAQARTLLCTDVRCLWCQCDKSLPHVVEMKSQPELCFEAIDLRVRKAPLTIGPLPSFLTLGLQRAYVARGCPNMYYQSLQYSVKESKDTRR